MSAFKNFHNLNAIFIRKNNIYEKEQLLEFVYSQFLITYLNRKI
jgi:hypothetical protein